VSYIQLTPLNVNFAVFTLRLDSFDVTHYVWLMGCVARDSERVLTTCVKMQQFRRRSDCLSCFVLGRQLVKLDFHGFSRGHPLVFKYNIKII